MILKQHAGIILRNGLGADVAIELDEKNNVIINLFVNRKLPLQLSKGKFFSFLTVDEANDFLSSLGFKEVIELEKPETVAEIMEEMKKKARPFNVGKENYMIIVNHGIKRISRGSFGRVKAVGTLYFDYDVAEDFAERLQAAYDREEWK